MQNGSNSYKRLWIAFAFVMIASFAVLGGYGFRIASMAPPIPDKVCMPDGTLLFDQQIEDPPPGLLRNHLECGRHGASIPLTAYSCQGIFRPRRPLPSWPRYAAAAAAWAAVGAGAAGQPGAPPSRR